MFVLGEVLLLRKLVALGDGVRGEVRALGEQEDLARTLSPNV